MFYFKSLLVVTFSIHLSSLVQGEANLTEVRHALDSFVNEIQRSIRIIEEDSSNIWLRHVETAAKELNRNFTNDIIEYIRNVMGNIETLAENVEDKEECVGHLYTLLNSTSVSYKPFVREDEFYSNLRQLGLVEMGNSIDSYRTLNNEFVSNCIEADTNCAGTSNAILAEIDRLKPRTKVIPYGVLIDVYIYGYQITANVAAYKADILEDFTKVLLNVITCLISKVRSNPHIRVDAASLAPTNVDPSIFESYENLVAVVRNATVASKANMVSSINQIISQCRDEYKKILDGIANTVSEAVDTADALNDVARILDPNISAICFGNLRQISDDDDDSGLEGIIEALWLIYDKAVENINVIGREVGSIGLEIADCLDGTQCESAARKIEARKVEIPLLIQQIEEATLVQVEIMPVSVRLGGYTAVKNAADQLLGAIKEINLCIQHNLHI